jgi:poly-gamma-glutamate synthesis protein (capsule biosynthesis protein)
MSFKFKLLFSFAVVSLLILSFSKFTFDQVLDKDPQPEDSTLTIIFAGDVMQHMSQVEAAWNDSLQTYVYDSCFKYVKPLVSSADIAIANLETTLAGKPYSGYPQFCSPDQLITGLLNTGFDYVGTANNHSCDKGKHGINRTIKVLDSLGMGHTGTFKDSLERALKYPLIIKRKGFKIALLNYTYGTNGIVPPKPTIVNMIDEQQIISDLKRAKDSMPDKIIVFIHWGLEYKIKPDAWQKWAADICFNNGADYVIGSHPHVLERMERKLFPDSAGKETLLVYSLGNYVSAQRDRNKDGGAMFRLTLKKKKNVVSLQNAGYILTWVYLKQETDRKRFYIIPVSEYEKRDDLFDPSGYEKMKVFSKDSRDSLGKYNINVSEIIYDSGSSKWQTVQ